MKTILTTLLLLLGLFNAANAADSLLTPKSFTYILQADAISTEKAVVVQQLAKSERDWLILDSAFNGESDWTSEDLKTIRQARPERKILAYLSIGEAEDYRAYWQENWDSDGDGEPDKAAPSWLLQENSEWTGNYKVRYWHKDWQTLITNRIASIMQQGFDGLYLDIVDAYEFFEHDTKTNEWVDNKVNPETNNTYRQDMLVWVKQVAEQTHKLNSNALIVPQNATALLADTSYVNSINAIGVEDLFTDDNAKQEPATTEDNLTDLQTMLAAHKPVLVIEYADDKALQQYAKQQALDKGLLMLFTDRELKTVGLLANTN